MTDLYVCIGSACFVKGSEKIIERLKQHISEKNLDININLKCSFCLDNCKHGVIIKVDDKIFKNLSPNNIDERLETEILPYIRQSNLEVNNE